MMECPYKVGDNVMVLMTQYIFEEEMPSKGTDKDNGGSAHGSVTFPINPLSFAVGEPQKRECLEDTYSLRTELPGKVDRISPYEGGCSVSVRLIDRTLYSIDSGSDEIRIMSEKEKEKFSSYVEDIKNR